MGLMQATVTPNPTNIDLSGKTIIITGSNVGLGLESARQFLVCRASTVILAVRTVSKGEAARQKLLADPQLNRSNPKADIKVMRLDVEDYKSVIAFADKVKEEVSQLHVLLLNAGIYSLNFELSVSGHERVTQINYLSNTLLALELLPLLRSTAQKTGQATRLSLVGSRQQHNNSLAKKKPILPGESVLGHFDHASNFVKLSNYGDTKLLCAMFIAELAKRVPPEQVIINNMCPGMVATGFSDTLPFGMKQVMDVVKMIRARTVEEGAWIINYDTVVAGAESHGRYLEDKNVSP